MNPPYLVDSSKSSLLEKSKVLKVFLKTFHHFFGPFQDFFAGIEDPRLARTNNYPLASLLFTGIFLFLCRLGAVRQVKFRLHTESALHTFKNLFGVPSIPHGDTLNTTFSLLDSDQVGSLVQGMIRTLILKRVLESGRFLKRYYAFAIDGTGVYVFRERHCEYCLTKTHNGKTVYYHMVLEAKLVTTDGFSFSVMSEFIENPCEHPTKQDCELKAFHRLAVRLKQAFPRLPILLLLDGLFAEGPVFQCCKNFQWEFFITLRDGDLPTVNQEFRNLQSLQQANTKTTHHDRIIQHFTWINDISYRDTRKRDFSLNVLECREKTGEKETTYRWLSSFKVEQENVASLGKAARCRWKIENQGFNTQKNQGFALEHPYSRDPIGMKVYYYLLQLAHTWIQLCERGRFLMTLVPEGFGSLKNISMRLLEDWRNAHICMTAWDALRKLRVQIRLDTS